MKTKSYTPEQINTLPEKAFETKRYWHRFSDGTGEWRKWTIIHESYLPQPVEVESVGQDEYIFPDGRRFRIAKHSEKRACKKIVVYFGNTPSYTIPAICQMTEIK